MRGGLLCQAGRSNDLHKASGLENLFKPNAMKLASMAEVQPSLCNYPNLRAHWPKVSEAWGLAPISIWVYSPGTIIRSRFGHLSNILFPFFGGIP